MKTEILEPPVLAPLSTKEQERYAMCNRTIERGLSVFYEVGLALMAVREEKLYREEFPTFEAYCRERWGVQASRLRQITNSAAVVRELQTAAERYNCNGSFLLPANECQVRPLLRLPENQRFLAWHEAVATAPNGNVTGAHVEKVVKNRQVELGLVPAESAPIRTDVLKAPVTPGLETPPEVKPMPPAVIPLRPPSESELQVAIEWAMAGIESVLSLAHDQSLATKAQLALKFMGDCKTQVNAPGVTV